MAKQPDIDLSRRERQIMDVIYRRGQASAAELMANLPDRLSNSAVRTLLRILENKGHLRHNKDGQRYVYQPTRSRRHAARSALKRLLQTFFDGSTEKVVAELLDVSGSKLSRVELDRLTELINQAKQEGR